MEEKKRGRLTRTEECKALLDELNPHIIQRLVGLRNFIDAKSNDICNSVGVLSDRIDHLSHEVERRHDDLVKIACSTDASSTRASYKTGNEELKNFIKQHTTHVAQQLESILFIGHMIAILGVVLVIITTALFYQMVSFM